MEEDFVQKIIEKEVDPTTGRAKGYGFIHREGNVRGLHFLFSEVRTGAKDLEEGCRVSFEEGEDRQKRPTAKRITIIANADGSPYAPGHKPSAAPELLVTPEFHEEELTQIQVGRRKRQVKLRLPLFVNVTTKSGQPIHNKEVKLDFDGRPAVQLALSVHTLADGKAFFQVLLPADATMCHLVAQIDGVAYGFFWDQKEEAAKRQAVADRIEELRQAAERTKAAAAKAAEASTKTEVRPEPTEAPKVKELQRVQGVYAYLIQSTPQTEVHLDSTLRIQTRKLPCAGDAPWTSVSRYTTDDQGYLQLQVKVADDGARGDWFACADNHRSKPQYVAHPMRPTLTKKQE